MASTFAIQFDPPKLDNVIVAVAPFDAFTGQVVTDNIRVVIEGHDVRPVRNLSGLQVFLNLSPQSFYRVRVDALEAGYFDPPTTNFIPPAPGAPDPTAARRLDIPLYRQPSALLDPDVTAVAGVISRAGAMVDNATIEAELPPGSAPPGVTLGKFETRSSDSGAFVLPLRLPVSAEVAAVNIQFSFRQGPDLRLLLGAVTESRFHSFDAPIDLTGVNKPVLKEFGT